MRRLLLGLLFSPILGCHPPLFIAGQDHGTLTASAVVPLDATPKEELRLVPQEVFLRNYLQLFGGLPLLEVQKRARATDGGQIFDNFGDYLSALGFPDYRSDLPRAPQTNALMVATFERMGEALCDRAIEHDLKQNPPTPIDERVLYAFTLPESPGALPEKDFAERFDILHKTFLSYPAKLAPAGRTRAFFRLYQETVARHSQPGAPRSRFTPQEAGWATVCYGLSRHPEYHLY
jgi:hypothetical protein